MLPEQWRSNFTILVPAALALTACTSMPTSQSGVRPSNASPNSSMASTTVPQQTNNPQHQPVGSQQALVQPVRITHCAKPLGTVFITAWENTDNQTEDTNINALARAAVVESGCFTPVGAYGRPKYELSFQVDTGDTNTVPRPPVHETSTNQATTGGPATGVASGVAVVAGESAKTLIAEVAAVSPLSMIPAVLAVGALAPYNYKASNANITITDNVSGVIVQQAGYAAANDLPAVQNTSVVNGVRKLAITRAYNQTIAGLLGLPQT